MPKRSHLLSDIQIKRWVEKKEPIAKSDGDGLTFTLSGGGTATWVLRYRLGGGRRKELTLGNYPDISLAEARRQARSRRVEIDFGKDPAAEKKAEKSRSKMAWTVSQLIDDFKEKKVGPPLSDVSIDGKIWDLEKILRPKLGSIEVRKVTSIEIVDAIETCGRPWTVCRRIQTTVTQLFDHANARRIIAVNPCAGIKLTSLLGPRPPKRVRIMLREDELRRLLPDVDTLLGRENGLSFRILLATCVRGSELVRAKKEHVYLDRDVWWIPAESVKTRTGFLVPLTSPVANWFQELIDLSGDSEYVLPARGSRNLDPAGHQGKATLWTALKRAFAAHDLDIRRFTPHDTRSTAKGHLGNMGVPNEISELALNHKLKGMEAIYDVREDIPERRMALEKWARFVASCENGEKWVAPPMGIPKWAA